MLDAELQTWARQELLAQPDAPSPTLGLLSAIEGMLTVLAAQLEEVMDLFRKGPSSAGWKACQALFAQILRNGAIAGDFRRSMDPEILGTSLAAMVLGNAAHAALTDQPLDPTSLATELYRAALAGLAAPPQPLSKAD